DRKRGDARRVEQIVFHGSLEDTDFENGFDADDGGDAQCDEQRQPEAERDARAQFCPAGALLPGGDRLAFGGGNRRSHCNGTLCFILSRPGRAGTGIVFRIGARRRRGDWLDSPVDSSSCGVGGHCYRRFPNVLWNRATESGARVRLTILLLAITSSVLMVLP